MKWIRFIVCVIWGAAILTNGIASWLYSQPIFLVIASLAVYPATDALIAYQKECWKWR